MASLEEYQAKCIEAHVREIEQRPLAVILPSEPGWRAIVFEPDPEDASKSLLHCVPIAFWGIEAPVFNREARGYGTGDMLEAMQGMMGAEPKLRGPLTALYPLDADKKRIPPARMVDVVGPDEGDGECVRRVANYFAEKAERDRKERERIEAATPPLPAP